MADFMCRPLGDRVILDPIEPEDITKGGIIIPDQAKEKQPKSGIVVAIGPGRLLENGDTVAPPVRHGEHVLFDKYGATGFERQGARFIVVGVDHLLGVFED